MVSQSMESKCQMESVFAVLDFKVERGTARKGMLLESGKREGADTLTVSRGIQRC